MREEGTRCLAGRGGHSPGRKLRYGEGGDCSSSSGWWDPEVAQGPLLPTGKQRAPELRAGDADAILFACLPRTSSEDPPPPPASASLGAC